MGAGVICGVFFGRGVSCALPLVHPQTRLHTAAIKTMILLKKIRSVHLILRSCAEFAPRGYFLREGSC